MLSSTPIEVEVERDYIVPNVLCLRDLVSRPENIDENGVRSFTGMDRNGLHYRNGLPEWTFICGFWCFKCIL